MSATEQTTGPSRAEQAKDLEVMIKADAGHLAEALAKGRRDEAHGYVDAILGNQRELEDLTGSYFTQQ